VTSQDPNASAGLLTGAIQSLAEIDRDLAAVMGKAAAVIVEEARSNGNFRTRLKAALGVPGNTAPTVSSSPASMATTAPQAAAPKTRARKSRRAPGPWDPFAVYGEVGEAGLRSRLDELELEQLRDIIAEQGMNNDGLAMKWKTRARLVDRIVERVVDRSAKGEAFRGA
jgi:hypothetical protein